LWNNAPPEGDKFVNVEIDWTVTTGATNAVQISLSGNSPVALSQICTLVVDNGRCGSDVQFVFPDSGFVLQVPAYNQGVYPVFTNALMFYVVAAQAGAGDVTLFEVCNSVPPPVALQAPNQKATAHVSGQDLGTNATQVLIPATVAVGTLESLSMVALLGSGPSVANVMVRDGLGRNLWQSNISTASAAPNPGTVVIPVENMKIRFFNGISVVVAASSFTPGTSSIFVNAYYQVP
jgi:hypothetical protein